MSNEMLMWIGIGIWVLFGIMAAVGYYTSKSSVVLPSGNTATAVYGGS